MRQPNRPYLQHGSRHGKFGSDPTPGLGVDNDWCSATTSLGTVADGGTAIGAFSSLDFQTDSGDIYDIFTGGAYDSVEMLVVGTYLIRARATFARGKTGTVQVSAVIGGDVTTIDYDTRPGGTFYSDIGPGEVIWEQLCVVNDLSVNAGAYLTFTQNTGGSLVSVGGHIQIFRLT
jgi:hypothetical protein